MTAEHENFLCVDCQADTFVTNDYYMIHDSLWHTHGAGSGMLCIPCLEMRMGRQLNRADFTDYPINVMPSRSAIMKARFNTLPDTTSPPISPPCG